MHPEAVLPVMIAFGVSALVCAALSRYRGRWALLDLPNDRSLHVGATPRSGGLGIVAGLVAAWVLARPALPGQVWALAALLLIAAVAFVDDIYRLPPLLRLLTHVLA